VIKIPEGEDPVDYLQLRLIDARAALSEWRQRAWKAERERDEARRLAEHWRDMARDDGFRVAPPTPLPWEGGQP